MDEFPESLDVPESTDASNADINSDVPEDIPDDIPEDVPDDMPTDTQEDVTDDIPEDVPDNTSEEMSDATPVEIKEDTDTDWERTSLTREEEACLREMEENGEIDIPVVNPDIEDPGRTGLHLPSDKTGEFLGETGNSEFKPESDAAVERMREYGRDTVEYKDGYPDFSPFTAHDSQWGKLNGQVEIAHMTDQRENPAWEYGRRPAGAGHDPNYELGNFAQADNEVAKQLEKDYPEVTGEDIADYRKKNGLTWHECADGKTMQLVHGEIHAACRHSGGVSEMKYRMAWGDITRPD